MIAMQRADLRRDVATAWFERLFAERSRAVAVETSRGLKISKERASHKIDVVVALAIAALGAVQKPTAPTPMVVMPELRSRSIHRPELAFGAEYSPPDSIQPTKPSRWQ